MCVNCPGRCNPPGVGVGVILVNINATRYEFHCQAGMVPAGVMVADCVLGRWTSDPGDLMCVANDCGDPVPANNVVIEPYSSTLAGSNVTYQCADGLVPSGVETAVCGTDGRWIRDPTNHGCSNSSTGIQCNLMFNVVAPCACTMDEVISSVRKKKSSSIPFHDI